MALKKYWSEFRLEFLENSKKKSKKQNASKIIIKNASIAIIWKKRVKNHHQKTRQLPSFEKNASKIMQKWTASIAIENQKCVSGHPKKLR